MKDIKDIHLGNLRDVTGAIADLIDKMQYANKEQEEQKTRVLKIMLKDLLEEVQ